MGRFPDYPTEEEGGSLMIFKEKDPAEVEAALKAMVSQPVHLNFQHEYTIQLLPHIIQDNLQK